MPLLSGISTNLADAGTAEAKMGTAIIKALFGDKYGDNPQLVSIAGGLQNFNCILYKGSKPEAIVTFLRGSGEGTGRGCQGDFNSEEYLRQNLASVNALEAQGLSTPAFLAGDGGLLMQVPETVVIDGKKVDVPADLQGGCRVVAQEYVHGNAVPNPLKFTYQAYDMGRLFGLYHKAAETAFIDDKPMENPVSLRSLKKLVEESLQDEVLDNLKRKLEAAKARYCALPDDDSNKKKLFVSIGLVHEVMEKINKDGLKDKLLGLYEQAQETWQKQNFDALPKTRCHGDFHSGNMFDNGIMYDMIGWMGDGVRLFDLCQALAISCHQDGKFEPVMAYSFVRGVKEQVSLTQDEIEAFPKMMEIVYLRSTATRLASMLNSSEIGHVTKSPLELLGRMQDYSREVLGSGKNWAKGELERFSGRLEVNDLQAIRPIPIKARL